MSDDEKRVAMLQWTIDKLRSERSRIEQEIAGGLHDLQALKRSIAEKDESTDPVVERVRSLLHERSQVGIEKYKTTLYASSASPKEKIQHALEEALDLANYLMWIIMDMEQAEVERERTRNDLANMFEKLK